MRKKPDVKAICFLGIGIALYVVLSLCLQVPVFENYYLCLGYIVLTVYCYSFGAVSGAIVGTGGCVLYCLLINGIRGMPGWAVGNLFIGITLGLAFKFTKLLKNKPLKYGICAATAVIASAVGILGIKSAIEWMLYSQPFIVRAMKNIYAFAADAFVIVFSIPLCSLLDKFTRSGSENV